MKTLKTILITLLFAGFSTITNATVKGGVTITGLDAEGMGKEMSRGAQQTRQETVQGAFYSIFIEKGFDTPIGTMSIGLDVSPYDIADGAVANERSGTNGAVLQTNTADISVTENYGAYLSMGLGDTGAYIRAMVSSHNLSVDKTNIKNGDVTQTNSTYPDVDFLGGHVSVGYEKDLGNLFIRGEVGRSEYEKVISKSSTGNTTVSAQISNGTHARLSIGKAF
tara:strand:- start:66 stop:734 length:669 start_codon:yes stop_codon:yes gene_type:complete